MSFLAKAFRAAMTHIGVCVALLSLTLPSGAQTYPDRPVRLIVPLAAGGATDVFARAIAQGWSEMWGQPVIVENKPGANQIVGMEYGAHAKPDGYTIILTGEAGITFNKYMYSKLPYDTLRDFAGISRLVEVKAFLAVPASLPANNAKEFVDLMNKQNGKLNYGSPGVGDPMHVGMEWFKNTAKVNVLHVPYKGSAAALQGMLSGEVQAMITSALSVGQQIEAGKVKVIVVSGGRRFPAFPNVQTLAEAGYPDVKFGYYLALLAPSGTPQAILQKISADTKKIMTNPAFRAKYVDPYDSELVNDTPEEFSAFLKRDMVAAEEKIRISGAKLD